MSVQVTYDARYVKSQVNRVLEDKIKAITTDYDLHSKLLLAFRDALKDYLPKDSGAMADGIQTPHYSKCTTWKDNKDRIHKRTLYPRYGNSKVRSRMLDIDPYEERTNNVVHYAYRREDEIYAARDEAKYDDDFLEACREIIQEYMAKR